MKTKRTIAAVFMAFTVLAGALSGCSDGTNSTSNDGNSVNTESTEPVDVTWLGYYTSNIPVSEDSYAEKLLEEACDINITPVTDVTSDNMSTYLASGDILDVTCFVSYLVNSTPAEVYDQDLIREIPEEWLYEYYPTGMQYLIDFAGEEFFENGLHLYDGKLLCIPYNTCLNTNQGCIVYRTDWLENLGLSEPTTLDEFHDMLYAFTYDDPDGNGIDDTYGISCADNSYVMWMVYGAFGIAKPDVYSLQDDGTVIYNGATEAYKNALTVIKEWYDEGIIDPESITDDRSAMRTKWANGTLGVMTDSITWTDSSRGSSSIVAMVEDVFGDNTVDVLGPMTTTYGDGTIYAPVNFPTMFSNKALFFSADATDEQVIAVLKTLEKMSSDDELLLSIIYGEEGVDYTIDADGVLAMGEQVSVEYQASRGIGDTFYGLGVRSPEVATATFSQRDLERYEIVDSVPTVYQSNNFGSVLNEASNQYQSEVTMVVTEYFSNVLLGNDNLAEGWDNYLARLDQAGLQEIIAEYEELLN